MWAPIHRLNGGVPDPYILIVVTTSRRAMELTTASEQYRYTGYTEFGSRYAEAIGQDELCSHG